MVAQTDQARSASAKIQELNPAKESAETRKKSEEAINASSPHNTK